MTIPIVLNCAPYRRASSGTLLALDCARTVHAAIDRRMPEANALTAWLSQNAAGLGLSDADIPEDPEKSGRSSRRGVLVRDWRKVEAALAREGTSTPDAFDAVAPQWLAAIAARLELDSVATRILALALHYRLDRRVERLFDGLSECRGGGSRFNRDAGLIALLLGTSTAEAATQLIADGKLLSSGLLCLGDQGTLIVLDPLLSLLRRDIPPAADFYDQLLGAITVDPLPWSAFAHLGQEAEIAASVLRAALDSRQSGVGILLYGPPGTGKTSFAAALAARVGAQLRPITEADEYGNEPGRQERLAGFRLAQRLAAPGDTLLLFDEAEDLFTRGSAFEQAPTRVFLHRLLENLTIPVIWTANDIGVLGPAVLRRMTMCLELRVPNLATRTTLWRRMGETEGVILADADAKRLARLVPAAPAVAATALRAARMAGGGAETTRIIVEGIARAVQGGALPPPEQEPDTTYDPALINADCDLDTLVEDLVRPGAPRATSFLLSGPPGAGKSAWVRHLAARMGMPVLQKRASDLLDPYLGGTEQNIAGAFAEAKEAQAFLVFDEADSLLLERAGAVRSWEISQVNEMLTWMEQHPLPFACTTNLAERLDRASLRRFLVKARFDWLTPAQVRLAFRRFFDLAPPAALDDLRALAPADFALVRRRAALGGDPSDAGKLLALLAAECDGRPHARLPIGFH